MTLTFLVPYFLLQQRTNESSVVDRRFAGTFDRPSSWVGAAYNCQIAITGSIATRWCFTIELKTVHWGEQKFAPVPGNNKADGETIGLSFLPASVASENASGFCQRSKMSLSASDCLSEGHSHCRSRTDRRHALERKRETKEYRQWLPPWMRSAQ